MKTRIILSALMLTLFATTTDAQLKVTSTTGKVKVGIEPPVGVSDDNFNVLSMHVYGPNGDYRAASKLAFGDFGSYQNWSWNVFVGEYRDFDSDQLWLHGKRGMYLTYGRGDDIIGYYDVAVGNRFNFNCDVYSYGILLASDARFKTNVNKLDNALQKVMKLSGVSYNLLPQVISSVNAGTSATGKPQFGTEGNATASGKEGKDKAAFEALEKQKNENSPKRYGLIAQEVKKILPDLVKQDSSNYMYVDYIGLIPVLIEAMKDQQKIIDAQNEKMQQLENLIMSVNDKVNDCCNNRSSGDNFKPVSSYLYQNTPNPFNEKTEIRYYLLDNVKSANLTVYDSQGNIMKVFQLASKGEGSVVIDGSELKPGVYSYILNTDGKQVDVKRMSLVK